jgi:hypothetical protein
MLATGVLALQSRLLTPSTPCEATFPILGPASWCALPKGSFLTPHQARDEAGSSGNRKEGWQDVGLFLWRANRLRTKSLSFWQTRGWGAEKDSGFLTLTSSFHCIIASPLENTSYSLNLKFLNIQVVFFLFCFVLVYWDKVSLCCTGRPQTQILLPPPPKYWDYRHAPPYPAYHGSFISSNYDNRYIQTHFSLLLAATKLRTKFYFQLQSLKS